MAPNRDSIVKLRAGQRKLKSVRDSQKEKRDSIIEAEIKYFLGKGRVAEAHNLCWQSGSTGIGVKRETSDRRRLRT